MAMPPAPVALQLYTLRTLPDLEAQLACAAEAGYRAVETLHDHGLEADRLRDLLAARGLTVASSHVPLDLFERDPAAVTAFHRSLGTPLLVVPYLTQEQRGNSVADWRALGQRLAALATHCLDQGIRLGYHNHDFEMAAFDSRPALDWLLEAAGEAVELELDIAWVVRGGRDPLALMERYRGRCTRIHVKDLAPAGTNLEEDGWADVGQGTLDWPTLLEAATAAGAEWSIVEHDRPRDPAASVARSLAFLQQLGS